MESYNAMPVSSDKWTCVCGKVNAGNFCISCGRPRPTQVEPLKWICECGKLNTGNFCVACGRPHGEFEGNAHPYQDEVPNAYTPPATPPKASYPRMNHESQKNRTATGTYEPVRETRRSSLMKKLSGNNKIVRVCALLALLIAGSYFGFDTLREKRYASGSEEFINVMKDARENIATVGSLSGAFTDGDREAAIRSLGQTALRLEDIHDSLAAAYTGFDMGKEYEKLTERLSEDKALGLKADDIISTSQNAICSLMSKAYETIKPDADTSESRGRREKLLGAIDSGRSVLLKASDVLSFQDRVTDEEVHEKLNGLYNDFYEASEKAKAGASEVDISGQDVSQLMPYKELSENAYSYISKKLEKDKQYVADMMKGYQDRQLAENEKLKQKNEVVFMKEGIQKSGNDLVIQGKFYNGTGDLVSGINEMLVDVTLSQFDKQVLQFADVPYQDAQLSQVSIPSHSYTNSVFIKILGRAPEGAFNNSVVNIHKIHWKIRRAVRG